MITSSIPFPPISWWAKAIKAGTITFDVHEFYQKMSYRNRYYLASPNGKTLMSLPLQSGRNQRIPVAEVKLFNESAWQDNHWKTIVSLYRRSPFFEYFEHELAPLFKHKYEYLHDFNIAGIAVVTKLLGLQISFQQTDNFIKEYASEVVDERSLMLPQAPIESSMEYYQVFSERTGFLPNCSILDLLFCEGSYAKEILLKSA